MMLIAEQELPNTAISLSFLICYFNCSESNAMVRGIEGGVL